MKRNQLVSLAFSGILGALYVVLTVTLPFSGTAFQFRLSEALCVFSGITPLAPLGLFVGCLCSNLLMGAIWQDVLVGSLATLLGALGGWLLRKRPWLIPLPTVICNALLMPFVMVYAYHMTEGFWVLLGFLALSETLSAYGVGLPLYYLIKKLNVIKLTEKT